ncbi:subtilisin-like protein [Eremomyces bilateralis CBS 781.70]|uniref:Subtilisin-like protein n=1 Tax=Eremomyces bilateralis CBS 781.70 TaxID=1392243 RepID=A0A6G1FR29_9PEZI|nr:subtilisin-like protein [Eremomyces bilateralis CBS 781.70]KAF1808170.1 subtilisin-like protein [Eremomyces bilateralis CBS 781.70]
MRGFAVLALLPLALGAPVIIPRAGQLIPGKWIVKMKDDVAGEILQEALNFLSVEPDHIYGIGSYQGFSSTIDDAIVDLLSKLPGVEYIEQDTIITTNTDITQPGAPWGLGRISHKNPGSTEYVYDDGAGEGTCSYVIDTGIYTGHSEFEGRATFLANYAGDLMNTDGNGHGTHVAGTIGGKTYGVAKKTKLFAVKVLNAGGSGSNSGVIAGINFVAKDAKTRSCPNGAVGNMSLGGSKNQATNDAVKAAIDAGVFMAVAAGNDGKDANNYSPASETTACTVGATDSDDAIASFSNFGSVVDIFAPGVDILSSWIGGTTATNSISGTSMATPHIAGLGAYLLKKDGKVSPAELCARIKELAIKDAISGVPSDTVNYIAFNGNPSG